MRYARQRRHEGLAVLFFQNLHHGAEGGAPIAVALEMLALEPWGAFAPVALQLLHAVHLVLHGVDG